jgi:uncharacterized protein
VATAAVVTAAVGAGCSQGPTADVAGESSAVASRPAPSTPVTSTPPATPVDPAIHARLHQAAVADDAAAVRDLLARGAGIESRNGLGRTPLVDATKNGATNSARVLIEAGADVNAKDDLQDSAYLYAGAEGLDEILVMTLRHGADVRSLNRFGGTALIPASEHGHVSTVRLLIDAGVDVDHVNLSRWTALQEAVVYGDGSQRYQQTVTALLDAGADPMIRDGSGRTVLDNAERLGQNEIARILQQHRN